MKINPIQSKMERGGVGNVKKAPNCTRLHWIIKRENDYNWTLEIT